MREDTIISLNYFIALSSSLSPFFLPQHCSPLFFIFKVKQYTWLNSLAIMKSVTALVRATKWLYFHLMLWQSRFFPFVTGFLLFSNFSVFIKIDLFQWWFKHYFPSQKNWTIFSNIFFCSNSPISPRNIFFSSNKKSFFSTFSRQIFFLSSKKCDWFTRVWVHSSYLLHCVWPRE